MKKNILLTVLLILGFMSLNALAQKVSRTDTVVTSTIKDSDANYVPFGIQSDLLGAYSNGAASTISIIQGIGDWELDMLASPTRRVFFDFSQPVPNTNPSNLAPPANGYYTTRFLAQCSARGFKLTSLAQGATVSCPLIVAIDVSGVRYSLRFNKQTYLGTNDVPWTCTSALNGKCNGWRMQSLDPNGNGKVAAQLLKITRVGTKTTEEARGKYYFSFDVSLTNP